MPTVAMTQYGEKNCSDRIYRQNSNIFAQKAGISKEIRTAQAIVKDNIKRQVKTGLGITDRTYQRVEGEPTLDRKIQGTADTPLLYSMLSNVTIQAHKSYTPGLTLKSPTLQQQIAHHNIAYIDDTVGHVSADYLSKDPLLEATTKMTKSAQGWNDVNNLTGGSLAYHKTKLADDSMGGTWIPQTITTNNNSAIAHQRLDRSPNSNQIRSNQQTKHRTRLPPVPKWQPESQMQTHTQSNQTTLQ